MLWFSVPAAHPVCLEAFLQAGVPRNDFSFSGEVSSEGLETRKIIWERMDSQVCC